MKKYIKPIIELIPADANILSDSTNPGTISIIDGPVIEDGSEILGIIYCCIHYTGPY